MKGSAAVGEKRPADEQLLKEKAENEVEVEAEAGSVSETENDDLDEDETMRRLAMAALALEDVFVVQGTIKPSEHGGVEVDIAQPDESVETLSFPCRLHESIAVEAGAAPPTAGSGTMRPVATVGGAMRPTETMQHLLSVAEESPFGHGSQTVKDLKVRKALHISADKIKSIRGIDMKAILDHVHLSLLPNERGIRAELLKLNIYRKGDFFVEHRDTPRDATSVGSLVVVLPTAHGGICYNLLLYSLLLFS